MLRFFVALIVVMFVGGHGLSDAVVSFSQGPAKVAGLLSSAPVSATPVNADDCCTGYSEIQTADTQAIDTRAAPADNGSDGSHCTAHCGIDAIWTTADLQSGNWNLELPLESSFIAKAGYEHFRPPIV